MLELFELIVKHSELPGDALYPSMQTPVLTVLGVEIVFIPLTLLWRANYCVLPRRGIREKGNELRWPLTKNLKHQWRCTQNAEMQQKHIQTLKMHETQQEQLHQRASGRWVLNLIWINGNVIQTLLLLYLT